MLTVPCTRDAHTCTDSHGSPANTLRASPSRAAPRRAGASPLPSTRAPVLRSSSPSQTPGPTACVGDTEQGWRRGGAVSGSEAGAPAHEGLSAVFPGKGPRARGSVSVKLLVEGAAELPLPPACLWQAAFRRPSGWRLPEAWSTSRVVGSCQTWSWKGEKGEGGETLCGSRAAPHCLRDVSQSYPKLAAGPAPPAATAPGVAQAPGQRNGAQTGAGICLRSDCKATHSPRPLLGNETVGEYGSRIGMGATWTFAPGTVGCSVPRETPVTCSIRKGSVSEPTSAPRRGGGRGGHLHRGS